MGLNQFDAALRVIQGFVDGLRAQKVPDDNPQLKKLLDSAAATTGARAAFDQSIHAQIQAMPGLHEQFVRDLLGQEPVAMVG